jgi:hypothetical protein
MMAASAETFSSVVINTKKNMLCWPVWKWETVLCEDNGVGDLKFGSHNAAAAFCCDHGTECAVSVFSLVTVKQLPALHRPYSSSRSFRIFSMISITVLTFTLNSAVYPYRLCLPLLFRTFRFMLCWMEVTFQNKIYFFKQLFVTHMHSTKFHA